MAEDLLHAGRAAVDIIPRFNPAAFAASVGSAVKVAQAEIAAAADGPLAARLGAIGAGFTGVGKAIAPASKAAAAFGAVAVGSAVSVDHAYHLLEQRTGAVGGKLEELETIAARSALATGAGFKQVAADEANLAQRLGASGPVLQGLTTQFENLRFVQGEQAASVDQVSAAFAQFGIPAKDASHAMDLLFVAAQKSGAGTAQLTDSLVAQGGVLRSVGLNFDQSVALLGTLAKAGIPAQAVMAGLRREFSQAAKDGVPANEALANTIAKIKELIDTGRSTEAAGIATKIFGGRGAALLFDAIKQGKLNTDDFAASLGDANGAINETANATESFERQLGKVRTQVELSLKPLGDSILPSVESGLHLVAGAIGGVAKGLAATPLGGVAGSAIVLTAATSGVLRLGGAIGTLAANRSRDFNLLRSQIGATETFTAAVATESAATADLAAATDASALAAERLQLATAEEGTTAEAATIAATELAAALEAEAAASGLAAEAAAATAVASTGLATTGALAGASLGTLGVAAIAGYAAFKLTSAGLDHYRSSVHESAVDVEGLTKSLERLHTVGDTQGVFSGLRESIDQFRSFTGEGFGLDKLPKMAEALDQSFATIASSQGSKAAITALNDFAAATGISKAEVIAATSPFGEFSTVLQENAIAAGKAKTAHHDLSTVDAELAKTARTLVDDTLAVPKAQDSALSASLSLTAAENAHADAQANLQHLLHGYPAASDEAKQAEESYASALQSTIDKRDAIVDAQRKYADVQRQGIENEIKLREATESANNSLLDKTDALTKAKDEEEKLRARGADHHDVEEAARATARAQREVTAGKEKVADARRDELDGPRKQAEAEADAAKAIVKAKRDSEDATKSLAKAVTDLDTVLHGRPATDKKVRDAQLALDQSTVSLRESQLRSVDSTLALQDAHKKLADDMHDPKLGSNAALMAEVDLLKKIELQSPITKSALDPLIDQLLTIAWVNSTNALGVPGTTGTIPKGFHGTIDARGVHITGSTTPGIDDSGKPIPGFGVNPGGLPAPAPVSDHLNTATMESHLAELVRTNAIIATHIARASRGTSGVVGAGGSDDAWATTAGGIRY